MTYCFLLRRASRERERERKSQQRGGTTSTIPSWASIKPSVCPSLTIQPLGIHFERMMQINEHFDSNVASYHIKAELQGSRGAFSPSFLRLPAAHPAIIITDQRKRHNGHLTPIITQTDDRSRHPAGVKFNQLLHSTHTFETTLRDM